MLWILLKFLVLNPHDLIISGDDDDDNAAPELLSAEDQDLKDFRSSKSSITATSMVTTTSPKASPISRLTSTEPTVSSEKPSKASKTPSRASSKSPKASLSPR